MNKKFLSAILFGALMVTSTGTFVSCKDYDDDIDNLQEQIDNLASKSDVEAKLSQLQVAIDAAKAEAIAAAKTADAEALGNLADEVDAMLAKVQASVEEDMAAYKAEIAALIEKAEAMVGEVADFVTSVELISSYNGDMWWTDYTNLGVATHPHRSMALNFFTLTEKANVFEEGIANAKTFEAGKQTQVAENAVLVRVSPTNAVLTPEMISLVDSKGRNLDEYMNFTVEKFTKLLSTRAAENNGLWLITPTLKKYDKDQFNAIKYVDVKKSDNKILYAVQVNNTLSTSEARYVTSSYDVTLGSWSSFEANNELLFTVDEVSVLDLNNRYSAASNPSLPKFDATGAKMYEELVWSGAAATEAILKDDASKKLVKNVTTGDDRHDKALALAVQGKPMTIAIDNLVKDDNYEGKVAALYVTLDYEANAVESTPSEWNAWKKYTISGLNTVVEGTSTTITIDSEETINDIIGFRVYAVNLDGTLLDPDGRAFYVLVGEQAAEAQTISATITPTNDPKSHLSVTKALTDAQSAVITSVLTNAKFDGTKTEFEMTTGKSDIFGVEYTVTFNKSKDGKKYVSATFNLAEGEIKDMINDKAYTASIVYKNTNGHILGEVNFELTKTMPTAFPEDFAFRPKQETTEGSGKFIAYMIPEGDSYVVPTPFATKAIKNLNNVFYGLDEYYYFEFAESKIVDKKPAAVSVAANEDEEYILNIGAEYIDNATAHAVSVWYTYPGISTYAYTGTDGKTYYKHGVAHPVAYSKTLEATYACWESASKWAWGVENSASLKPVLQWTAEGVTWEAKLSAIKSTNSYNNDYFGLDLESLLVTNKWLAESAKDAEGKSIEKIQLVAGDQVNPYYVPEISGSVIKFTQKNTQVDAAPTADHAETLAITLVDAFGHRVEISLDVTVKAPEKK